MLRTCSFDNEPSYEIATTRYRYESDRRRKFEKQVTKSIYNRLAEYTVVEHSHRDRRCGNYSTITVVLEHFRLLFSSCYVIATRHLTFTIANSLVRCEIHRTERNTPAPLSMRCCSGDFIIHTHDALFSVGTLRPLIRSTK